MHANATWIRWTRVSLAALMLGVQLEGCASGVAPRGFTSLDESSREPLEELHLNSVTSGTRVRIILRGDSLVSGKFRGASRMEPEIYARRVAEFRAARTDSTPLPGLGSPILVLRRSKDRAAHLDGFGYRSLELRWNKSRTLELVPFDNFEALTDSSGHVWTRDALDKEMLRGRVPCFSQIEVETASGRTQVPVDQVKNVIYQTPSGNWVAGALVLVGMVVIVVAVLSHRSKPTGPQCEGPPPTWFLRNPGVRAALIEYAAGRGWARP
jgi:hypothetical protein